MKNYCISPDASLIECMRSMDITGAGIALAVDSEFRLIGTISDGDVRKALVKGCPLDSSIDHPYQSKLFSCVANCPQGRSIGYHAGP